MKSLFALLLLFCYMEAFTDSSYFVVDEIKIKVSDTNSLAAKQKALISSQKLAFEKLLLIQYPELKEFLSKITSSQIQECIYDYSIDKEKFAGKMYMAKFSFRFSKDKLKNLLTFFGIKSNEQDDLENLNQGNIILYTVDYLKNLDLFQTTTVKKFTKHSVILTISTEQEILLKKQKIKFAKTNAQTST